MNCPVPEVLVRTGDRVRVTRAWPREDGHHRFEGRDQLGRVRAGTVRDGQRPQVTLLPPGEDRKLPDLPEVCAGGQLIVHRAGRRAVVRLPEGFAKVVRRGAAPALADRAIRASRVAQAAGLSAPDVLVVRDGWLLTSTVHGVELHTAARESSPDQWCEWWQAWADRWPSVVTADTHGLVAFTADDEATVLRGAVDQALRWGALPDPQGHGRERTAAVCRALTDVHRPVVGVAHRDLHDKQLLTGADGIGVLDFDTASAAEPALDLANLAVHARWRTAQGWWTQGQADVVVTSARRVARALAVPEERWIAYAAGTSLRLAALYAFRPPWHALAVTWWKEQMRGFS